MIAAHDLNVLFITGPGYGAPSLVAHAYLEGIYSEVYLHVTEHEAAMKKLFTQFSLPGSDPSRVVVQTPGSLHRGGELGYALSHAFGGAFDYPELIVAAVMCGGEAEPDPLATYRYSNKFLNPVTDGAVLPILHLNGYKVASPTIPARMPKDELQQLLEGYGYEHVPHNRHTAVHGHDIPEITD